MEFRVLRQQIERQYDVMSPKLKRAARCALDNPDDVALLSMRQFAAKAGVHPSTMSRLPKELGLGRYTDFRQSFQSRLRSRPHERYLANAKSIQKRAHSSRAALISEMLSMEMENLARLDREDTINRLIECADRIKFARRVFIGGVRTSYCAAFFLHYGLRMVDDKVTLLDGRGGAFADDLRNIGVGDVLVAISFLPYSRNMVHAARFASERGAHIISITDSRLSPLVKFERVTAVVLNTRSPSIFRSVVPAMTAAQVLFVLLLADGGAQVLSELSESEAQLEAFDAYLTDEQPPMMRNN